MAYGVVVGLIFKLIAMANYEWPDLWLKCQINFIVKLSNQKLLYYIEVLKYHLWFHKSSKQMLINSILYLISLPPFKNYYKAIFRSYKHTWWTGILCISFVINLVIYKVLSKNIKWWKLFKITERVHIY